MSDLARQFIAKLRAHGHRPYGPRPILYQAFHIAARRT
jgi:hypothetical protein